MTTTDEVSFALHLNRLFYYLMLLSTTKPNSLDRFYFLTENEKRENELIL